MGGLIPINPEHCDAPLSAAHRPPARIQVWPPRRCHLATAILDDRVPPLQVRHDPGNRVEFRGTNWALRGADQLPNRCHFAMSADSTLSQLLL